jgi:hypothetical protein
MNEPNQSHNMWCNMLHLQGLCLLKLLSVLELQGTPRTTSCTPKDVLTFYIIDCHICLATIMKQISQSTMSSNHTTWYTINSFIDCKKFVLCLLIVFALMLATQIPNDKLDKQHIINSWKFFFFQFIEFND